ncbi:MAG TPA: site-specific DNA-methyltransferase [Noviherbaspirillum sp.]|nr:site-specific DNA-methyltransferase [Noviherbaspirillum sp.]
MTITILVGDVREKLCTLPDSSVHCVVTSPPYWGLRDYGVAGQIGLEPSPAEFIATMVGVFEEVRRVLRTDGTCWINMGDSYATSATSAHQSRTHLSGRNDLNPAYRPGVPAGLKPKDLCMMPHRLAIALQDAGWWVRQDIVWAKPNPMPESVQDRCTKAHEYIFLLTKSDRYHYDADAIKEPVAGDPDAPRNRWDTKDYKVPGQKPQKRTSRGGKGNSKTFRGGGAYTQSKTFDNSVVALRETHGNEPNLTGLRNCRSVWEIATKGCPEAHFATFPPELPERCIKAGCPVGGVVLDPFFGAGTTGLVADRLQRDCIGIELNPAYAEIARRRIQAEASLFADIKVAT